MEKMLMFMCEKQPFAFRCLLRAYAKPPGHDRQKPVDADSFGWSGDEKSGTEVPKRPLCRCRLPVLVTLCAVPYLSYPYSGFSYMVMLIL